MIGVKRITIEEFFEHIEKLVKTNYPEGTDYITVSYESYFGCHYTTLRVSGSKDMYVCSYNCNNQEFTIAKFVQANIKFVNLEEEKYKKEFKR